MEEQTKIELEILCDGMQPLNEQGDPIHNIIILYNNNLQQFVFKEIKTKALKFIHYFIDCKIYNISANNCITGIIWKVSPNNKKSLLGRYVRLASRFTWEPSV
jgi:hypothetical protein